MNQFHQINECLGHSSGSCTACSQLGQGICAPGPCCSLKTGCREGTTTGIVRDVRPCQLPPVPQLLWPKSILCCSAFLPLGPAGSAPCPAGHKTLQHSQQVMAPDLQECAHCMGTLGCSASSATADKGGFSCTPGTEA